MGSNSLSSILQKVFVYAILRFRFGVCLIDYIVYLILLVYLI